MAHGETSSDISYNSSIKMRSQLLNQQCSAVDEALQGLVKLTNNVLVTPRFICRLSFPKHTQVSILSFGGSGHEPAHAGYVGEGMLTGAICGDVFASPPVSAILHAILHCTGTAGTLLICKNYTGDVTNAELAMQTAKQEHGIDNCEMVICADDVATKQVGARGLAGTLFCHKIAGAMSARGASLVEIVRCVSAMLSRIHTMSLSLSSASSRPIPQGKVEIGLGIHGEQGIETRDVMPSQESAKLLVAKCFEESSIGNEACAVLINNLGGLSNLEMLVFARDLLQEIPVPVVFSTCGALMTSLSAAGASLSVLHQVTENELVALYADTTALFWPRHQTKVEATQHVDDVTTAAHKRVKPTNEKKEEDCSGQVDLQWIQRTMRGCHALVANADRINELDARAGDGDCGTTLKRVAIALIASLDNTPFTNQSLINEISSQLRQAGGSLGGMLARFFPHLLANNSNNNITQFNWDAVWEQGINTLPCSVGARSFVDALLPALQQRQDASAASAARIGADSTSKLEATVGRARYLPKDSYLGYNDAGAEAVAVFLEAFWGRIF